MLNTIWTYIKQFFSWLYDKLSFKDYLIIGLVMLMGLFYIQSRYYQHKSLTPVVIYNTDSLSTYKNKLKEEYALNVSYVQTIDQLKHENNELALEYQKLKDNPIVITKEKIKFQVDTLYMVSDNIEKSDSVNTLNWHYFEPNDYYALSGSTLVNTDFSSFKTRINNLSINTELTIDIIEKDSKLNIIGKTTNPYITITNLNGVVIDPTQSKLLKKFYKQKKWSLGPMVGYGVNADGKFNPYIGIGLSYGLIQF